MIDGFFHYAFMQYALLAVLLITPLFALLGTVVMNNRMTFFSDIIGHGALAGVALSIFLHWPDPLWGILLIAMLIAISVVLLKRFTRAATDSVLGILFSLVTASGILLLSQGGNFAQFSSYLIGDILTVSPAQIGWLAVMFMVVILYWAAMKRALFLTSISPSLAKSRRISVWGVELSFAVLLAIVVALSIPLVGILMVTALIILPASTARLVAHNVQQYWMFSLLFSVLSGILGLAASFALDTSAGATIALAGGAMYAAVLMFSRIINR